MSLQRGAFKVRSFNAVLGAFTWLSNLPNRLTPPPFRLIQIGSAFWQSRALYVAAKLDVASALGDKSLSVAELSTAIGADPDALGRLLRMLSSIGVFEEKPLGMYRNSKLSMCLCTDNVHCVRSMILMHNSDTMSRPWYEQLEQGVRTGGVPFRLTHGKDLFAWMDDHPDFDALFGQAMDSVDALTGDSFATEFDWKSFDRVIDVGGSRGAKSLAILRHHSHIRALVVDRAQAFEGASEYWESREKGSITSRLKFQVGDALEFVPIAKSNRDAYFLSAVLHCFNDDTCIRILRNVAQAATPSGAFIVVLEVILPDYGADYAGTATDLQMFMGTEGRERTKDEWEQLVTNSGLQLREIVSLASLGSMLVLKPVAT